jgi:hypothetical protein
VLETQAKINEWARETFGGAEPIGIAVRANVEAAELLSAVSNNAPGPEIAEEVADVAIILLQATARWDIEVRIPSVDHKAELPANVASIDFASMVNVQLAASIFEVLQFSPVPIYRFAIIFDVLSMLATRHGKGLSAEINAKMKINRQRTWEKTKSGHFQHTQGTR